MNTILYMEIPGLPAYVKLSENAHAIPLRGDMVRIEAEELPCPYSIPARCWKQYRLPAALYGMKRPRRQAWPIS